MPVNQMGGIYATYPQLVAELSFTTVKDYDDWIARLHAIPKAFDQVTANMSIGMEDKRVPPKYLLEKTLEQVKQLATQKPEDSPLALPLKKFPASVSAADQARIKTEMLAAITKEALPAYSRFARFLEVAYIPAGRTDPGISSLPGGAKYYQFLIRRTTTTNLTADQIHQIGLDEVKKDEAEMLAIAQKLGFKDLKSFQASLKANPKLKPTSREAAARRLSRLPGPRCRPSCRNSSAVCPRRRLKSSRFPISSRRPPRPRTTRPARPMAAAPDAFASTPTTPRIATSTTSKTSPITKDLPGHHLQISIAQELAGCSRPSASSAATRHTPRAGASTPSGWARTSASTRIPTRTTAACEGDIWRAIRLVVDTGVHSQHWTRQQMVDYFHDHSAIDETSIQAEVDRYIAWPSQALAYKIGQLKILELRDRAKKELGDKFDIRAFHDQVIDSGSLPLDVLDERITAWIASQKAAGK